MSRRSSKGLGEIFVILVLGVILGAVAIWNFLVETNLIWVALAAILGFFLFLWYRSVRKEKARKETIESNRKKWGNALSDWLLSSKYDPKDSRINKILSNFDVWDIETIKSLIERKIWIGITEEMVRLAYGQPNNIDSREITAKTKKLRYIYGTPRKDATYIWFKDGMVTKIKS